MQNQRLARLAIPALLAILAVGCTTEERVYDVSVKNSSTHPVTLVLRRDDKPESEIWMTPEQLADKGAASDKQWGLGTLPPGKTANADKVRGTFKKTAQAWVRIYMGDLNIGQMLKITSPPNRQDVPLEVGDNQIVVRDEGDHIRADRVGN